VKAATTALWDAQDQHRGDRWRLFQAIREFVDARSVLYPGCFVDIAPSFVFPSVTYVDSDPRTPGFFNDETGVRKIVASHRGSPWDPDIRFIFDDYTSDLGLPAGSFDLLVSLYAGFVSEHCSRYLALDGTLLVNPSHGDAALASLDQRYRLAGVVTSRSGRYRVSDSELETYLIPKSGAHPTVEELHVKGRGVAYTKSPFAYLFTRIA
jgi:hypothetical protein